MSKAEKNLNSL